MPSAADRAKAAAVNRLWASFAATGQPTDDVTDWPRYDNAMARLLLIGEQDEVVGKFRCEQLDFLQQLPRSGLAVTSAPL